MTELPLPDPRVLLETLGQTLSSQWDELLSLRQSVLKRGEDEAIHDLRVASRRLRTALELAAPGIGRQQIRYLRRPVRELTRELSQLRNLDEASIYLQGLHDDGVAPLTAALGQQRRHELRRIRRLLKQLPCTRLTQKLHQAVAQLLNTGGDHHHGVVGWLSERNVELYRPIYSLMQVPELPERAEERHRLRIAIKKWRYFNELLASLCSRQPGQLVTLLKQYQNLLGDLNDREVFLEMVRSALIIPAALRQRIEQRISEQHQQLVLQFEKVLKRQPLQYQFMA